MFERLPGTWDSTKRAAEYAKFAANANDDALADMLLSQDFDAIAAAVPHLTDETMLEFASTRNGVAHWPLLLKNPHTTPGILRRMAQREDLYYRYGAGIIKHPNTPDDVREHVERLWVAGGRPPKSMDDGLWQRVRDRLRGGAG